jgi:hypothetical protein
MSLGISGIDTPTSNIVSNKDITFTATDESEPVLSLDKSSGAVAVSSHPDNAGYLYVGDSSVSVSNGFPLEPGDAFVIGHDVSQDPLYVVADTAGDEARIVAFE